MYKNVALATAIAIMPFSEKGFESHRAEDNPAQGSFNAFHFKSELPSFITGADKKNSAPYSRDWLGEAQENIRKSEYNFRWEKERKTYCTPNRRNNLRFFYTGRGFTVEPRTTQIPIGEVDPMKRPDEIKYRSIPNWKVKFDIDKRQLGEGSWSIAENKAEYRTKNIAIQYINNDEGMRQNFIVYSPLSKRKNLKLNFDVKTKLRSVVTGNAIQFFRKKKAVLSYEQLKVWDASNRLLNAVIRKTKVDKYYIEVNTNQALYPITIDPLSTTPAVSLESNQDDAEFGWSVAGAGDVNADGYSDVIVGAPDFDHGQSNEGAAFVFHGSAAGVTNNIQTQLEFDQVNADFGWSVSGAGDVNADGYSDVVVGAMSYHNGQLNEGAAFVYLGSSSGVVASVNAQMESDKASAAMGRSVAGAGDVNGDGYSDIIIGAPNFSNGELGEGVAFVYHGSATGINTTIQAQLESNQASAEFGWSVASAGDVNADGYSDVIVGADYFENGQVLEGAAFVYLGGATSVNTTAQIQLEKNQAAATFGTSVASAGDVNGDGYSDVIVGAAFFHNGQTEEGGAFVYHGSAAGITATIQAQLESNQALSHFGDAVACAGDVNGDGYADVVVGAYMFNHGQADEGAAFVYLGSTNGINTTIQAQLEMNHSDSKFGYAVAGAGDVNGDGFSDVIIGAYEYENGQTFEGLSFVYHGSAAGLSLSPNRIQTSADHQVQAQFGVSVSSAGDVNADGYSDVIIGAWWYDDGANTDEGRAFVYHGSSGGISASPNTILDDINQATAYYGASVACAGDVNADGYSDVIIGAMYYKDGANTHEGRAFVHHGSAAGILVAANSTPDDANQANAALGVSVAGAGDVNGDGYSDVIVGAYGYTDGANAGEGRAFLYYGSATGISASPNSTPDDANQATCNFGVSVASAGDVNGDGYSDVIIGAHRADDGATVDEGLAYIYYGSSTGLSASPNSVLDDADQANAGFGYSVAGAGDVNGDGYGDVIVGAYQYDDGANIDEGRAFVYYGSASGLSATPNSILDDAEQDGVFFGWSVAGAGDVNGDGYSDVIVGAIFYDDVGPVFGEGRCFVYHGSVSGLSASPDNTPDDADHPGAVLGYSVACAGDINADGYSDVIIGAPQYDDVVGDEGRIYVYNGNDSVANKRNNLRLYNADLITPVNSSNFIFGNFGAGLYAKSFLGRTKGKMVWETRLNYNAYSGTPITNSILYTSQQSSYTDLGLTGIELKSLITKLLGSSKFTKLRARVKYDPATAITGQVYGPWRNASSVIDANSLGVLPIELISFKAVWLQKGKTAQLNFTTDKEFGVCCFEIEKSLDGFNFSTIGTLPAKNIAVLQSYSFVDNNANSKNQFYRLKIKGTGGQIQYSNIQQLSAGSGGQNSVATEILAFPNPTTDVLQLQLNNVYDKMNVQIVNAAGQIVKQLNDLTISNHAVTIRVDNLPAGHYWLRLHAGTEKQLLQFMKQ